MAARLASEFFVFQSNRRENFHEKNHIDVVFVPESRHLIEGICDKIIFEEFGSVNLSFCDRK